jgi:hypothetical protein
MIKCHSFNIIVIKPETEMIHEVPASLVTLSVHLHIERELFPSIMSQWNDDLFQNLIVISLEYYKTNILFTVNYVTL